MQGRVTCVGTGVVVIWVHQWADNPMLCSQGSVWGAHAVPRAGGAQGAHPAAHRGAVVLCRDRNLCGWPIKQSEMEQVEKKKKKTRKETKKARNPKHQSISITCLPRRTEREEISWSQCLVLKVVSLVIFRHAMWFSFVCMCIFVSISLCVCIYLYTHLCVCIYIYTPTHVYVYLCTHTQNYSTIA